MSKTLEEKIDGIMWLALFMVLEPVKRVLSAVLYPLAYLLRGWARKTEVLWPEYLFVPRFIPAWLFLNDSELMKYGTEYANLEKYYPSWLWRICKN